MGYILMEFLKKYITQLPSLVPEIKIHTHTLSLTHTHTHTHTHTQRHTDMQTIS